MDRPRPKTRRRRRPRAPHRARCARSSARAKTSRQPGAASPRAPAARCASSAGQTSAGDAQHGKCSNHRRQAEQRAAEQPSFASERADSEPDVSQPIVAQRGSAPVRAVHDEVVGSEHDHRNQRRTRTEGAEDRDEHREQERQIEQAGQRECARRSARPAEQQVGDANPNRRSVSAEILQGCRGSPGSPSRSLNQRASSLVSLPALLGEMRARTRQSPMPLAPIVLMSSVRRSRISTSLQRLNATVELSST